MSTRKSTTGGQHSFSKVPSADIQRSVFDRSCGLKTTFDAGKLIPIFLDEALPGDTFNMKMTQFARLATPLHPTMDNMYVDTFFFAVPMRLVWNNWEKFNGAQDDPGDSTDFLIPTMDAPASTGHLEGSLSDYMGIPTQVADLEHSALWHRAYNLIWNEWFRDQNIQDSVVVDKDDGPDDTTDYAILNRGKRRDYFSSSLPFPQKGPSVLLPLGDTADVTATINQSFATIDDSGQGGPKFRTADGESKLRTTNVNDEIEWPVSGGVTQVDSLEWGSPTDIGLQAVLGPLTVTGTADLAGATAATINSLREAFQLQKMFERDARGGTRYTEIIKSHFSINSTDQRLQRPEYLGGSSAPIIINQVEQTSSTASQPSPQGNLTAYGVSQHTSNGFMKSFTEHCLIIGLISIRADLNYQQGLNRMFSRSTRFDFYWPSLAHLGEQSVLQKEIFADGIPANDDIVFGYQERFAEYRYKPSLITGAMRSNAATSLDTWHLAQDFASAPTLNDAFIKEDPPLDRIIAVPSEPHLILDAFFQYRCARPMPTYSVPGMIDHF